MGIVSENIKNYSKSLSSTARNAYGSWKNASQRYGVLATIRAIRKGRGIGGTGVTSIRNYGTRYPTSKGIGTVARQARRTVNKVLPEVQLMGPKDDAEKSVKENDEIMYM